MNPIHETNQPSQLPQPMEAADFFAFLEEMKKLLEGIHEAILDSKKVFTKNPETFFKLDHQVNILMKFEKACSEMETFWQEMRGDSTLLPKLPERKLNNKSSRLPTGEKNEPVEGYVALADLSGKKAKEIFFPPRGDEQKNLKASPSSSNLFRSPPASRENVRSELPFAPKQEQPKPLSRPAPSLRCFAQPNILERAPMTELWQKIKPLLDHLIVVVETQENMSKPSEKLVQLVRSFMESHSSFMNLDVFSLLKVPTGRKALEPANVSAQPKPSSEKKPLPSPSKPSTALPSPFSEKMEAPTSPLPEAPLPQDPKTFQPFAAPYIEEKKLEERKSPHKKKRKKFWFRKDPDEEKNPS